MNATVTAETEDQGYSVGRLRRQYNDWAHSKREEIEEARQARHYYHDDQWSGADIKEMRRRKQPVITYNRIKRKVNGVVGVLERLRQDPKAYARTPKHEEGAELATSVIRYALDSVRWPEKETQCVRDAAIEGIGVCELGLEEGDHGDPEITLSIVDPDTFFYDPRSFREDFTDARYMGVAKWLDLEEAQEQYPDHAEELSGLVSSGSDVETWAQQDRERRWIDIEQKRVRVIEHWYLRGSVWHYCHYAAGVELVKGISPFKDERGKSACRYIAFSADVDHDGDRYGFFRTLKGPQDEINARRSKALHELHSRRVKAEKGAVENVEKARRELARPDGWVEFNPGKLESLVTEDAQKQAVLQGQMEMLAEAKAEIENFGPNPALLGDDTTAKSGRAIQLMQQAGLAELGPFLSGYRGWKLRVYRAVWNAIQQFWQAERWIRVTDDEGMAQYIQVNGLEVDEFGYPQLVNALGSLDVDLILDEGPDTVNTMADVFELLESLAAAGVPVPPQVAIEMSALPSSIKKKVIGMIEQAQQADPMAQRAKEAEVGKVESETAKNKAQAVNFAAQATEKLMGTMYPEPEPQQQQVY